MNNAIVKTHTDTRTILITGATGFVGAHLIKRLVKTVPASDIVCLVPQGDTVRVSGAGILEKRLLDTYRRLGVTVHSYPAWGTAADYRRAFETFGPIRTVIYLAANNNRWSGTERLFRDNVETLKRFIHALDTRLADTQFIFASSVMAEATEQLRGRFGERTALKLNPYGCTKLAAEALLRDEQHRFGYQPLVLRFASVYGKESQFGLMKSVQTLTQISKIIPVPYLIGRADIVHVLDVAEVLTQAVAGRLTGMFDLRASPTLSVGELVEHCAKARQVQAKQFRLPACLYRLANATLDCGSRIGLWPALQLQSLVSDIYVGHGVNVLETLGVSSVVPFAEKPVLAKGVHVGGVAVIGASGLVGARIVQALSDRGFSVRCGIRHTPLPVENLDESRIERVACDTSDTDSLASFLQGQHTVVYAGGLTTAHGKKTWEEYLQANTAEVLSLIACMRAAGTKRIIFLASQAPAHGAYGLSKSLGESAVRNAGLTATILKPGLVVGDRGLVQMIGKLVRLVPVFPLPSDTPRNTELVDADTLGDVVADILADTTGQYDGQTIYVGSAKPISLASLARTIAKLSKRRTVFVPIPRSLFALLSYVGVLVPFFPFNREMFEGIYRQKDAILAGTMRLADEDPETILQRHIRK